MTKVFKACCLQENIASDFQEKGTLWESLHEYPLNCRGSEGDPAKVWGRKVGREAVAGLGSPWKECRGGSLGKGGYGLVWLQGVRVYYYLFFI